MEKIPQSTDFFITFVYLFGIFKQHDINIIDENYLFGDGNLYRSAGDNL